MAGRGFNNRTAGYLKWDENLVTLLMPALRLPAPSARLQEARSILERTGDEETLHKLTSTDKLKGAEGWLKKNSPDAYQLLLKERMVERGTPPPLKAPKAQKRAEKDADLATRLHREIPRLFEIPAFSHYSKGARKVLEAQKHVYPDLNMAAHPALSLPPGIQQPAGAASAPVAPPPKDVSTEYEVKTDAADGVDPFVATVKVLPAGPSHEGARSVVFVEIVHAEHAWDAPKVERNKHNFKQLVISAVVKYSLISHFFAITAMGEPAEGDRDGQALYAYHADAVRLEEACNRFKLPVDKLTVAVDDWRKDVDHTMTYTYTFSHELEPSSVWETAETLRGRWFLIPFIGSQVFADNIIRSHKRHKPVVPDQY